MIYNLTKKATLEYPRITQGGGFVTIEIKDELPMFFLRKKGRKPFEGTLPINVKENVQFIVDDVVFERIKALGGLEQFLPEDFIFVDHKSVINV